MSGFLKEHQLNVMLFLSGVCGMLVVLTLMTKALTARRKRIIVLLEASAMLLLLFDRFAYIYRGDISRLGFWMVRISNFIVYLMYLFIMHAITMYLYDLFHESGKLDTMPKRLLLCEGLFTAGVLLLVISQFTGLYYTIDEQNLYHRSKWNTLCYVIPFLISALQISAILQYRKLISRSIVIGLLLNAVIPIGATIAQIFMYGVSLTNMTIVGLAIVLYLFALNNLNQTAERAKKLEIEFYKKEQQREHDMFEQTAEALASAIDAKDTYTRGHSSRVAEYSEKIAREAGKSEEECEQIYFAALLHDVGKIGIDDRIINKNGKLDPEEFAQIKLHPVYGNQILSQIQQSPYLRIGAHYHHERYDGNGYPDGLKGEDIPEIARIIGVADAYDAMTSKRSYRDPIPQDKVREELVKGMGTQFDPKFAKIMLHLLDLDTEYRMREQETGADEALKGEMHSEALFDRCSSGVSVTDKPVKIRFRARPDAGYEEEGLPTLILFDALDGQVQDTEEKKRDLLYAEYGRIRIDGVTLCEEARKMETTELVRPDENEIKKRSRKRKEKGFETQYDIEAMRYNDHLMMRIRDGIRDLQIIVALPDSSRFSYISVTGEHCTVRDIRVEQEETKIGADAIPRIAEEISFIRGCPEGDIPNIQVDRWRSATTKGMQIHGGMKIRFHAMSLPTARLVWHCPFVSIYTSKDGSVEGEGFREFALIRLDGENWESDRHAENTVVINSTFDFVGWKEWKTRLKAGVDCVVSIWREENTITVLANILGMVVKCTTVIRDDVDAVYAALTGDQCAISDIHIEEL